MSYGHAERTLAAIRLLEAETRDLLNSQDHLDPEQEQWLRGVAESRQDFCPWWAARDPSEMRSLKM